MCTSASPSTTSPFFPAATAGAGIPAASFLASRACAPLSSRSTTVSASSASATSSIPSITSPISAGGCPSSCPSSLTDSPAPELSSTCPLSSLSSSRSLASCLSSSTSRCRRASRCSIVSGSVPYSPSSSAESYEPRRRRCARRLDAIVGSKLCRASDGRKCEASMERSEPASELAAETVVGTVESVESRSGVS